ncbi:MAG TPA: ROK family protein [bacterium]|nr:ROK family protein [bacterium]HPN30197.1 ROK family protein [bacterium]
MKNLILGIDVGGSGIKAAKVNIKTGKLVSDRFRLPTPEKAKPEDVADTILEILKHFKWQSSVGCGFPAAINQGTALTAANIHKSWIGLNLEKYFHKKTGCKFRIINDADAAGLAEIKFGAGKKKCGTVLMLTVGTGVGSALFSGGVLFPNTELGHIELFGREAESNVSDAVRKKKELSFKKWAERFDAYLIKMNSLLYPDLIILGGGVVKKKEKFFDYLSLKSKIVPASLGNDAGIIGAAIFANN